MEHKQNLHTHTTFCDGKHTPEEMVRYAIDKGFSSLGFSGHGEMMNEPRQGKTIQKYREEINALKQKYKGQLDIYLGLEKEMRFETDLSGYDYLIGSVHELQIGEETVCFDLRAPAVRQLIDTWFGGDGMAFARQYYEELAQLPAFGKFDIIGHFDIITKNLEIQPLFDDSAKEYLDAALEAMAALKGKIPFFEVNTGAIARGYRTTPYPATPLLKAFKDMGFGAVISSDCHDGRFLDCCFEDACGLLKECGFSERYVLTDTGFTAVSL